MAGLSTASLDRIDNNKGYTEDNVQWIHKDINFMKQEYDEKYFIETCEKIANNSRISDEEKLEIKNYREKQKIKIFTGPLRHFYNELNLED